MYSISVPSDNFSRIINNVNILYMQWNINSGFCGAWSTQQNALAHGAWISQDYVRTANRDQEGIEHTWCTEGKILGVSDRKIVAGQPGSNPINNRRRRALAGRPTIVALQPNALRQFFLYSQK